MRNEKHNNNITTFNYDIGKVVSQFNSQNLGITSYGTVHINSNSQVHIVPWMPR